MSTTRTRLTASGALVALALMGAACSQHAENNLAVGGDASPVQKKYPTDGGCSRFFHVMGFKV